MKAMVLAAGLGERMRPLTDTTPKPLLSVAGKPLIAYHFEALARAGVRDVVVNVSWLAEQLVDFCGDGSRWGLRITISREPAPLETAGGIIEALPLLGDAPFLLVNGDVYADIPLERLASTRLDQAEGLIVLVPNPEHHPNGDFALDDRRVASPDGAAATFTYSGIGVYQRSFFAGCVPGKQPLRPWLERAIALSALRGEVWHGDWTDVGTPERLALLDRRLRDAGTPHR